MSTGTRVSLSDGSVGQIIGWKGLWHAVVHLDDGRTVVVAETELRRT